MKKILPILMLSILSSLAFGQAKYYTSTALGFSPNGSNLQDGWQHCGSDTATVYIKRIQISGSYLDATQPYPWMRFSLWHRSAPATDANWRLLNTFIIPVLGATDSSSPAASSKVWTLNSWQPTGRPLVNGFIAGQAVKGVETRFTDGHQIFNLWDGDQPYTLHGSGDCIDINLNGYCLGTTCVSLGFPAPLGLGNLWYFAINEEFYETTP